MYPTNLKQVAMNRKQKIWLTGLAGIILLFSGCKNEQAEISTAIHEELQNAQINAPIEQVPSPFTATGANLAQPEIKIKRPNIPATTRIPIIMLHYVRTVDRQKDMEGYDLSITPESFEKILQYLSKEGYHTIHLADLANRKVPEKSIILSFDDGYEDFYTTALPLLNKYGFTASSAIITDKMDGTVYMSPAQVQTADREGVEILSHTVHHADLSKDPRQEKEITESKTFLEKLLGKKITGFVYPAGKYNNESLKFLRNAGYEFALTEHAGYADLTKDLLQLRRIRIDNRNGYEGFISKLNEENPALAIRNKTSQFSLLTDPQPPY